jgi:hypothetical protein
LQTLVSLWFSTLSSAVSRSRRIIALPRFVSAHIFISSNIHCVQRSLALKIPKSISLKKRKIPNQLKTPLRTPFLISLCFNFTQQKTRHSVRLCTKWRVLLMFREINYSSSGFSPLVSTGSVGKSRWSISQLRKTSASRGLPVQRARSNITSAISSAWCCPARSRCWSKAL